MYICLIRLHIFQVLSGGIAFGAPGSDSGGLLPQQQELPTGFLSAEIPAATPKPTLRTNFPETWIWATELARSDNINFFFVKLVVVFGGTRVLFSLVLKQTIWHIAVSELS